MLNYLDIGKQINDLAQPPLVQFWPGKVFGENVLQLFVLLLNAAHGIVDHCADLRRMSGGGDHAPPGIFRHEEDILGCVLVDIFFKAVALGHQFVVLCLETVGDVL